MIVLGIDPGLATVGIGVVEKCENALRPFGTAQDKLRSGQAPIRKCALRLVDWCTIGTSSTLSTAERLAEIAKDLSLLIQKHEPDLAVVEKLYFGANHKTAMDVAQARGVLLVTLAQASIEVLEPTPLQLKLAVTGDGKADKRQVQDMLARIFHLEGDLFRGASDDATDAVGMALYGAITAPQVCMTRVGAR